MSAVDNGLEACYNQSQLEGIINYLLPMMENDFHVLQTWKVASQQCDSYGWEESFTRVSMRLPTAATSGPLTLATIFATNLATSATNYGISKVLGSSRYFH
ncbi:hypothetical protein AVEN_158659-1 [Araneus ventricosus]|uniref:Uncharacterized protein n=1 Tax=Araneus ventricosus TaxID=182803 RepID=A0A4Y2PZR8_ARAVE|nr:hypothetical protein AVEN_158659-1 [Araneus ventricosus]